MLGRDSAVYAVVETGSKQYRVSVGQTIDVELLPAEAGSEVELDRVLMVGGEGAEVRIGTPVVAGAKVVATVAEHHRGDKIVIFKMKAKKRYRRKTGHRQELTRLTIKDIIV
jgi:large subunit ribosomal protein L21